MIEAYESKIVCLVCGREVPLFLHNAPKHFWWCRFRRLLYYLTGE